MEDSVLQGVLQSAQFIASTASRVSIEDDGVRRAAEMLLPHLSDPAHSHTDHTHSPDPLEPTGLSDSELLEWIFLLDTLNFCFWSDTTTLYTVNYRGRNWTGYRSLCAALCRAKEDLHLPVHKPSFYGSITMETMKQIFRSDSSEELPLLEERMTNLHQAARVLNKHFSGSVSELVSSAGHSAERLVKLLVEHFYSFRDISTYKGRSVSFLKRAQIFPADVWHRFGGRGFGEFNDIHTLTMFADYRVPQGLLYIGVLIYDTELLRRLRAGDHLTAGGEEEAEIRGCSIWAVELIKKQMVSRARAASIHYKQADLSSVKIDYYLWNYAKTHASEMNSYPIHRTNTIFY